MLELKIHDVGTRPTIFHVTQHKCASQWVAEILKWCAFRRVVLPLTESKHFIDENANLVQGLIYPTLYISKDSFEDVISRPNNITDYKIFVVIRDLRDLLVSLYFSEKNSHASGFKWVDRHRASMKNMGVETGLMFLLEDENGLCKQAERQASWLNKSTIFKHKIFKYEDLVEDDHKMMSKVLKYCNIKVEPDHFNMVMKNNSFEALAGRKRGKENINHHYRKGVAGDWQNYFTPKLKDEFKKRYNHILVAGGYEKNDRW